MSSCVEEESIDSWGSIGIESNKYKKGKIVYMLQIMETEERNYPEEGDGRSRQESGECMFGESRLSLKRSEDSSQISSPKDFYKIRVENEINDE